MTPDRPNALSELRRAQEEAGKALVYTDASARDELTGIGLVGPNETDVIGSFTVGWMSTCPIPAAEVRDDRDSCPASPDHMQA